MVEPVRRPFWRARLASAFATRLRSYRRQPRQWRLLAPAVFMLAGLLFVTSAVSSGGIGLRAGDFTDLDGLANSERHDVEGLRAHAAQLDAQVNRLSSRLGRDAPTALQRKVDALRGPVGLDPVRGPGVTVVLNDAPHDIQNSALNDPNVDISNLLVHQQDIQAVANALWAGGAEAMTIQGQRVVATTGIKCVGNSVVLHDVPYAPPYTIRAIGPTAQMLQSIAQSPYVDLYMEWVNSKYHLGWALTVNPELRLPGFTGSTELRYARPLTAGAKRSEGTVR
jgi:uncharacterized protein YlxW (UPF0749 family)